MDQTELEKAGSDFVARIDRVGDGQWAQPTPCADWDVRALVNHVVSELLWVAPLIEGKTIEEVGDKYDGDVLGDDPKAACHAALSAAVAAAGQPGAAERIVHLSFGDTPAGEYVTQIASDVTIHTWDLARGADQDDALDADLVDQVFAYFTAVADQWRAAGAFGPPVETAADADTQTKLLAITGRKR